MFATLRRLWRRCIVPFDLCRNSAHSQLCKPYSAFLAYLPTLHYLHCHTFYDVSTGWTENHTYEEREGIPKVNISFVIPKTCRYFLHIAQEKFRNDPASFMTVSSTPLKWSIPKSNNQLEENSKIDNTNSYIFFFFTELIFSNILKYSLFSSTLYNTRTTMHLKGLDLHWCISNYVMCVLYILSQVI